jgi:hypothetical protein
MAKQPVVILEWWRDPKGYRLTDQRIVRNSPNGAAEVSSPIPDDLFRIFLKQATSAEGLLKFMNNYGPLTRAGRDAALGEFVPTVLDRASVMRRIYGRAAANRKPPSIRVAAGTLTKPSFFYDSAISFEASIQLLWNSRHKAWEWEFWPDTLLDALLMQLGQRLAGDTELRTCRHCGEIFDAGPGTGRRLDAKFCCDAHRISFNSLNRSKETPS